MSAAKEFDALQPGDQFVVAMELWEAALELHRNDANERKEWDRDFLATFDAQGAAGMRDVIAGFVPFAWQGWTDREVDQFDDCFDWVWCPLFLAQCVDWRDPAFPQLKPEWREIAAGFRSHEDATETNQTSDKGEAP